MVPHRRRSAWAGQEEHAMPNVTKMLVPVDFSEFSERALSVAADLALKFGSTIHLVHVYPAAAYVAPPLIAGPVVIGQFRDESQRVFDAFAERVKGEIKVAMTSSLVEGVPHVEILRCAKDVKADMIVMGTHGRTGLDHLLLGSVAERVVRGATVPVLTVPRPATG
jgi:nucleotide-binding universal stress UspA family protein